MSDGDLEIRQGDVYWVDFGAPDGSEPAYARPSVVVQNDVFNRSRIRTVVVCAVTTNLRRANAPGHVLLEAGEGRLQQPSVVNVSQLLTVDRTHLGGKIGMLTAGRVRAIVDGIRLMIDPA